MSKPKLRTISKACSPCVNTLLVVKLVFVYNCRDFISQNVKIVMIILYSLMWQMLLSRLFSSSFLQNLYIKFLIFPSQHIGDFQIQAQLLSPLESYMQFEKWLWGISYYSPQSNTVRLSILWALKGLMVLCKNKTTYKYFWEITSELFFFKFLSAYLRGIYLVVSPIIVKNTVIRFKKYL